MPFNYLISSSVAWYDALYYYVLSLRLLYCFIISLKGHLLQTQTELHLHAKLFHGHVYLL